MAFGSSNRYIFTVVLPRTTEGREGISMIATEASHLWMLAAKWSKLHSLNMRYSSIIPRRKMSLLDK